MGSGLTEADCLLGCTYACGDGYKQYLPSGAHFLSTFPYVTSSDPHGIDYHPHFTDGETETQRLLANLYTALNCQTQGKNLDLLIPSVMIFPVYHLADNCVFIKLKD